jgi:hypothetical protein
MVGAFQARVQVGSALGIVQPSWSVSGLVRCQAIVLLIGGQKWLLGKFPIAWSIRSHDSGEVEKASQLARNEGLRVSMPVVNIISATASVPMT